MINFLALIGACAVVYIGYKVYAAYKAKIAEAKAPPAPDAKTDGGN